MILILFYLTCLCSHKNKLLNAITQLTFFFWSQITQLTKTGFLFQFQLLNFYFLTKNQVLTYDVSESICNLRIYI